MHVMVAIDDVLIATEKSSQHFSYSWRLAMKNKKSSENGIDTASAVDIAPSALANLADKLKLDLAKPNHAAKSSKQKKNEKKEVKEVPQTTKTEQAPVVKNGQTNAKKSAPIQEKSSKTSDSKSKVGIVPPTGKKVDSAKATNSDSKSQQKSRDKDVKRAYKSDSRPPKLSGGSKNSAKGKNLTSGERGATPDIKDGEPAAPSLLEEILALGGTKEDLELVEDIDSDEDIAGEPEHPAAKKTKESNDKKVCRLPPLLTI